MFYLIAFLLIIVFIIETFKSIKLFDYYNEQFKNTKKINNNYSNSSSNNNIINSNIEHFNSSNSNSDEDIKQMTKHGFLPHNIGDSSNYQLNPNKTSIQELQEKYDSGVYKYAPSYDSSMVYNEDYFNPIKDKYTKNRRDLPRDWKCQRSWFDCAKDENYFNKFKKP
jgi:hypothetical protein